MNIERVQHDGKRYYKVEGEGIFPSVTSVLKHTKDQSGLDNWRRRVGYDVAEKIGNDAAGRGTMMHKMLELYLNHLNIEDDEERLDYITGLAKNDSEIIDLDPELKKIGTQLFYQIYNSEGYLQNIKKVFLQEVFLWMNKGLIQFAGTVDNASYFINDKFKIVDFKTSLKPKQEKYITDYKIQTSAYAVAIWNKYGIKPDGAEIWISCEVGCVQKFILDFNDIKKYFKMFKSRLEFFYTMYPPLKIYK
jgi:hypothetical protein